MREILFRGKLISSGEWVYGSYVHCPHPVCIGSGHPYCMWVPATNPDETTTVIEVDPETVGQYTGLTDCFGIKIFEGDIIEINHPYAGKFVSEVIWDMDCWSLKDFYFTCFDYPNMAFSEGTEYMKVIGNIFDNPELLGGENNGINR